MRHVALVAIEQAVEADRRVVMRGAGEGAEAVAGVEARFAHGAIALVKIAAQPVAADTRRAAHTTLACTSQLVCLRRAASAASGCSEPLTRNACACGRWDARPASESHRDSTCWRRPSPAPGRSRSRSSAPGQCGRQGVPAASTWSNPFRRPCRRARASHALRCGRRASRESWLGLRTRRESSR